MPSNDSLEDYAPTPAPAPPAPATPADRPDRFSDLGLAPPLLDRLRSARFEHPSPVQALAIPKALLGRDLLCQAKSGTGKTAVFVLAILQLLIDEPAAAPAFLVAVHAKEMIEQIVGEFARFSPGPCPAVNAFTIGIPGTSLPGTSLPGVAQPISQPISQPINQPAVIVGTPARLARLLAEGIATPADIRALVIDECDFIVADAALHRALRNLLSALHRPVQTLMFTATLTRASQAACEACLRDPFRVLVDDDTKLTLHGLRQFFLETREASKLAWVQRIAAQHRRTIVFSRHPQNALYIAHALPNARAAPPHLPVRERLALLAAFRAREFSILAATDLLSRGIDVQDVDCVVNYDLPADPQTYLHRVGRAGRFETRGTAVSFVNGRRDAIRLNEVMDRYEVDIAALPEAEFPAL